MGVCGHSAAHYSLAAACTAPWQARFIGRYRPCTAARLRLLDCDNKRAKSVYGTPRPATEHKNHHRKLGGIRVFGFAPTAIIIIARFAYFDYPANKDCR